MSQPPSPEEQIKALKAQIAALRTENWALRTANNHLSEGKWEDAVTYGHPYLTAKIARQRWAINAIQWRGWEPEFIIYEQYTPEDLYAEAG